MRVAIAAFGLVWLGLATPTGAAELKGHIATYALAVSHPGVEAEGQLLISAFRNCKLWTVNQTSSLELGSGGRTVLVMVQQHKSEETVDGRSMKSSSEAILNGQKATITSVGFASGLGKAGKIELDQGGTKRTIDLPDGAYFGIGASNKMIEALEAGKKQFAVTGFDAVGTNELLTQNYTVVASPFAAATLPEAPGLLDGAGWTVKSTFDVRGVPREVYLTVHRSGVTSRMRLQLDKITIDYVLQSVQPLPAAPC